LPRKAANSLSPKCVFFLSQEAEAQKQRQRKDEELQRRVRDWESRERERERVFKDEIGTEFFLSIKFGYQLVVSHIVCDFAARVARKESDAAAAAKKQREFERKYDDELDDARYYRLAVVFYFW
jgi:hypothetical protein